MSNVNVKYSTPIVKSQITPSNDINYQTPAHISVRDALVVKNRQNPYRPSLYLWNVLHNMALHNYSPVKLRVRIARPRSARLRRAEGKCTAGIDTCPCCHPHMCWVGFYCPLGRAAPPALQDPTAPPGPRPDVAGPPVLAGSGLPAAVSSTHLTLPTKTIVYTTVYSVSLITITYNITPI